MRATSLPTASPVAAAALALVAAVLAPLAVPSTALAERWLRPVPGEVARSFDYDRRAPFMAGAHRGVDLTAAPATTVRAACAGRVVHAGPVAGGDAVVSVRCGSRRVSYLPLARVAVAGEARVEAGATVGTVAAGHGGLHVGVRREGDRFGYVDPLRLLRAPDEPSPLPRLPPPPVRLQPAQPPPQPRAVQPRAVRPRAAQPHVTQPPAAPRSAPAPWPVWAGLAGVLAGAAGSGTVTLRQRRRRHAIATAAATPTPLATAPP